MANNVRVDEATHAALVEIARLEDRSLTETLARAVETYRRATVMRTFHDDYAALRADGVVWAEEKAERDSWDDTNLDGGDE